MKRLFVVAISLVVSLLSVVSNAAVTASAGSIPAGLPARIGIGLFEGWSQTWMKSSGVPWDYRYAYFTKGWANNWGYGAYDGAKATEFFNDCAAGGYVAAIQYYQMNGEAGGGEAQFLSKTQNATTMRSYFSDFKLLMQQAKAYGKPVVIILFSKRMALVFSNNNRIQIQTSMRRWRRRACPSWWDCRIRSQVGAWPSCK